MSMNCDSQSMLEKYGTLDWVAKATPEQLRMFLDFRMSLLKEELKETVDAVNNKDPEEVVDGLIDLIVVALGTLNAFHVDVPTAWDEVHAANMNKEVGVKPSRPNPLGLPDLIKPADWVAPSHENNHGLLTKAL